MSKTVDILFLCALNGMQTTSSVRFKSRVIRRTIICALLLGVSSLMFSCASGNSGIFGVELDGQSPASNASLNIESEKPYNVVGECLLAVFSEKFPASGLTYRDLTAKKQVQLWFTAGTDRVLPSAQHRLFDIKIDDANGKSVIRAIAANYMFTAYIDEVRSAVEQCK